MKKYGKTVKSCGYGLIYGLLAIIAAVLLLKNLYLPVAWAEDMLDLGRILQNQVVTVLQQLRQARIGAPWYLALLPAAAAGGLSMLPRGGKWIGIVAGVVLFLPLVLAAAWLTRVNSISVGALLGQLIPLLPELL